MKEIIIKNCYTVTAGKWMEAAWSVNGNAQATNYKRGYCDVYLWNIPDNVTKEDLKNYVKYCR